MVLTVEHIISTAVITAWGTVNTTRGTVSTTRGTVIYYKYIPSTYCETLPVTVV